MDLLILVTLGTQYQSFSRLLDYIEKSDVKEEIIVQAGHTKYNSSKMKIINFMSYTEMENYIDKARVIITHGGTGSIISPLKKGKKIIACARLSKFNEHVDDHQKEIVEIFADEGYILELKEGDNLNAILKGLKKFTPKLYKSNTETFILQLKNQIDE